MKGACKNLFLFLVGGFAYVGIEILARGFSHWTMFVVGGICFLLVGLLNEETPKMPLIKQMTISCIMITIIEFVSGCILNLGLGLDIWDYSDEPFNLFGQICLKHTCYWFLLSFVAILLDDWIRHVIFHEPKQQYTLF